MHHETTSPTTELAPLDDVPALDAAVFQFFRTFRNLQRTAQAQGARLLQLRADPAADPKERADLEAALRKHRRAARQLMANLKPPQ